MLHERVDTSGTSGTDERTPRLNGSIRFTRYTRPRRAKGLSQLRIGSFLCTPRLVSLLHPPLCMVKGAPLEM
jgi:hypothetical protein